MLTNNSHHKEVKGKICMVTISKHIGLQIKMTINFWALCKVVTIITNRLGSKLKATCDVPKSEDFKFAILI